MSDGADDQPATPRQPPPSGPFGGVLSTLPIAAKFALTAGVALGLFASIVLSYVDDALAMPALIIGIAAGLLAAIVLSRRRP